MPLWDADNRLKDDKCAILTRLRDNEAVLDYWFYDPYKQCAGSCEDRKGQLSSFATRHTNMRFWDGYGIAPCDVDVDDRFRHDKSWTCPKERQQLPKRIFTSVPDLSRGQVHANTESMILSGEDTSSQRQCSHLAERNYDRFVPGVAVQCVEHVVPSWTWGGDSSRDITRSKEFLSSIGYSLDEGKNFTCAVNRTQTTDKSSGSGSDSMVMLNEDDDLLA
jgi:hypothetical protein